MNNDYSVGDRPGLSGGCTGEDNPPKTPQELTNNQGPILEDPPNPQTLANPGEGGEPKQVITGSELDNAFTNEQLQHWLDLRDALCDLGTQHSVESIPLAFWEKYRPIVDRATALDLVYAVSFLNGEYVEKIRTALYGICLLSDYRYGCKTSPGMVPALYVEFLIRYQSLHDGRPYMKRNTALYAVVMVHHGHPVSKLTQSMGAGSDYIAEALSDLDANGILLDADGKNAPGAGRDDIDASFAFGMTPEAIAAGISNEDLQARKNLKELEEMKVNGVNSIGSAAKSVDEKEGMAESSPDGDTHSEPQSSAEGTHQEPTTPEGGTGTQSEGARYKTCETKEVDPTKLRDDTLKDLDEAADVVSLALEGRTMDMRLLNLLKFLTEAKRTVADYYALACPGEEGDEITLAFNFVPAFVEYCDSIRSRCEELIQVKEKNKEYFDSEGGGASATVEYWRKKLVNQVVQRKSFLGDLDDEQSRYTRICKLLEEVKRYVAEAEAAGQDEKTESVQDSDAAREKQYAEARAKVFASLEAVIQKIEGALEQTSKGTKFYQKAEETLQFLHTLQEDFGKAVGLKPSETPDIRILQEVMVSMLELHMRKALDLWEAQKKRRQALKHMVDFLNEKKFTRWVTHAFYTYNKVFQDSRKASEGESEPPVSEGQDDGSQEAAEAAAEVARHNLEEAGKLAVKAIDAATTSFTTLIALLRIASNNQVARKNSTPNPIPEAIVFLEEMLDRLAKLNVEVESTSSLSVREALCDMAVSFTERNEELQEKLGVEPKYTIGKQVANSINRKSYHDFCVKQAEMALDGGENSGWDADVLGHYKEVHEDDPLGVHSPAGCTISPSERRKIILELWKRGMDPTSVKAWLQYITERSSKDTFADPMGNVSCFKMTPDELSNSFRYLTGYKFSGRALWDYLVEHMGYTRHQCVKEEQIGKAHPQRDIQYRYVDSLKEMAISNDKILLLSGDTKAVVKLGRFKHDNGLLLCSPDGKVFRVYDHDFVFTWLDLYGEDGCPVGRSRRKEKAVVHPCAIYDVLANTCHVSFVLGTENSESMANILIKAIQDKLKERPEIESVVLLTDGGGVNSSNSYIWKNELLRVADATNLKLQIAHYPPGCSRHNPVERGVFAPLSRAWKGKSLYNLEVLANLTCSATTKRSKKGSPLKVTVLIDLKHYKTVKQKLADNEDVVTREEFEKAAEGRISYPFTEAEGDLHKWNYIVMPKEEAKKVS